MATRPLPIEQIMTMLGDAPVRIAAFAIGLTPVQLRTPPAPGEWSANDVLAHLRACADVRGGSIARIVAEEWPTIRATDPRTWMAQTDYPQQTFDASLQVFAAQRAELAALLARLDAQGWSRSATVVGAGRPLARTVRQFAEGLALHERPHLKQIGRVTEAIRRMTLED